MSGQYEWRWCKKCGTLNYTHNTIGPCRVGGVHDTSGTGGSGYYLNYDDSDEAGQSNWNLCSKCQELFYAAGIPKGLCAGGGEHQSANDDSYTVMVGTQPGWRHCNQCQALVYNGHASGESLPCPGPGGQGMHNFGGSGEYCLTGSHYG